MNTLRKSRKISALKCINARQALEDFSQYEADRKLAWLIMHNLDTLQHELDVLGKTIKEETDEYKVYKEELVKLKVRHTANSRAYYKNRGDNVPKQDILDIQAFNEDIMALNEEYDSVIDEQVELSKENQEFFKEHELEIDYYPMTYESFPKTIKPKILINIKPLLETPEWMKEETPKKKPRKKKKKAVEDTEE